MGQVSRSAHIKGWARQAFVQRFSQNLESLYGLGFTYSMIPSLRDAYGDDKEGLKEALHRSMVTYITEPYYGAAINGMTVAMEEEKANGGDIDSDLITNTRLGLMGPFAGFGDSFHWGTIRPIVRAMFIPMATSGVSSESSATGSSDFGHCHILVHLLVGLPLRQDSHSGPSPKWPHQTRDCCGWRRGHVHDGCHDIQLCSAFYHALPWLR